MIRFRPRPSQHIRPGGVASRSVGNRIEDAIVTSGVRAGLTAVPVIGPELAQLAPFIAPVVETLVDAVGSTVAPVVAAVGSAIFGGPDFDPNKVAAQWKAGQVVVSDETMSPSRGVVRNF